MTHAKTCAVPMQISDNSVEDLPPQTVRNLATQNTPFPSNRTAVEVGLRGVRSHLLHLLNLPTKFFETIEGQFAANRRASSISETGRTQRLAIGRNPNIGVAAPNRTRRRAVLGGERA